MKTYLLIFGLVAIACTQSDIEQGLYEELTKGPNSVEALESVLNAPEEHTAIILYMSTAVALKEKRAEDSGFLFYVAQLRVRFDKECFPPRDKGGNSPLVAYAALSQQLGSEINPAVMTEPKVLGKIIERIKVWNPRASKDYNPGYDFTERKTEKEAQDAAKPNRTKFISGMSDLCRLLDDAEYCAAFRVVQAYNLTRDNKRPTKESKDKATETMKRIEKAKGLKGFLGLSE